MISSLNEKLQQKLEYTLLKPDCHSWWISKMQSDTLKQQYAIKLCFKRGKMSHRPMEYFRLLFGHLAWIEHQFLSSIWYSRKAGSLWGIMRGVGGVRKSEHQSWLAKGLGLGLVLLCWCFKGVQEEIPSERARVRKGPHFKSGQWHSHQDNAPVHNSILATDYLTKMGINNQDLDPCDFWLFPKLRGCHYETSEEMKKAVTKVIDTLTREDFHGAFQKMLVLFNKCIAAGGY